MADKPNKKIYLHLKHGTRRRKQGNKRDTCDIIHHRVPLEKRSKIVNKRIRLGNIEVEF